MNPEPLRTYLRTHRLRCCLSQDEVAFLLGGMSGSMVGRHENSDHLPGLLTVLAYAHIFGAEVPGLYEGVSVEVRQKVVKRAGSLLRSLEKKPKDPRVNRKIEHLRALLGKEGDE